MEINPKFVEQVQRIAANLGQLDYYQILRVDPQANAQAIRLAYHAQAKQFHPDRYRHLGHDPLQQDLVRIAKRITEAYVTLRDDTMREHYDNLLQGPSRENHLRYSAAHEEQKRTDSFELIGKTPQGRKLYQEALDAWERNDKKTALQNLKLALVYESQNKEFQALLSEWQAEA